MQEIYSSRADGDVAAITAHAPLAGFHIPDPRTDRKWLYVEVATIQKELGVDGPGTTVPKKCRYAAESM